MGTEFLYRPWGFREVEALKFQDNQQMKMVSLSTLNTGRLYPPTPSKNSPYSFLLVAESTPGPQPKAPSRAPYFVYTYVK